MIKQFPNSDSKRISRAQDGDNGDPTRILSRLFSFCTVPNICRIKYTYLRLVIDLPCMTLIDG